MEVWHFVLQDVGQEAWKMLPRPQLGSSARSNTSKTCPFHQHKDSDNKCGGCARR